MCSNAPYTMRSAMAFLPESISTFMNFATSTLPNYGSGNIPVLALPDDAALVLLPLCLGAFRTVFGARLLAILHTLRIQRAAHHVVAHARQILHATAADQHNRVLLQIMAFAANIRNDLKTVCQSHLRHFAQR